MSRTYRIRSPDKGEWRSWKRPDEIYKDRQYSENWAYVYVYIDRHSKEGKKAKALFHKDTKNRFKEPGPSWFRNLFAERPLRQRNKLELKKYISNPEYEPVVLAKGKLPYWT